MYGLFVLGLILVPVLGQVQHFDGDDGDDAGDFAEFEDDFEEDTGFADVAAAAPAAVSLNADPSNANKAVPSSPNAAAAAAGDDFYADDDDEEDGVVQDEENEFEHFHDEEEFEGYRRTEPAETASPATPKGAEPKLTMAKVPMHFR